jgi:4-hydroxy-4-methyl-2-oxoglutarate aldolase
MSGPSFELVDRLARMETAVMSDVLDEAGFPNQVLAPSLRPVDPRAKLAGVALCIRGDHVFKASRAPLEPRPSGYELERRMRPGLVGVIDAGSQRSGALIGGFVAATLKAKGCRGLVINGGVRDNLEIAELGLPTFSAFASPINASRRWEVVEVDCPLAMPGAAGIPVTVHPGDLMLGDYDGVVVVPSAFAEPLIVAAERLDEIEQVIKREIAQGADRETALARNPRFKHIPQLR